MDFSPNMNNRLSRKFLDLCAKTFGWKDLSRDVIMDVGCGEHGFCAREILVRFPKVGTMYALDKSLNAIRTLKSSVGETMKCEVGDIERKQTLRKFKGQMTKVVSSHVFYLLETKEQALQNIYYLLKPGGEAALLFCVKFVMYDWLEEFLQIPRWKNAFQRKQLENPFKVEASKYRDMAEKVGFRVKHYSEDEEVMPYPSDEICKGSLFSMFRGGFNILPEMLEVFKEDCFQVYQRVSPRNNQGQLCYTTTLLSLLLVKPAEGACSAAKAN